MSTAEEAKSATWRFYVHSENQMPDREGEVFKTDDRDAAIIEAQTRAVAEPGVYMLIYERQLMICHNFEVTPK